MQKLYAILDQANYRSRMRFISVTYNKILLYACKQYEVYLICWLAGQETPVHDHPEEGCLMRVVSGKLVEDTYHASNGVKIQATTLGPMMHTFRHGKNIVHRIRALEDSVSLHVYLPPGYVAATYDIGEGSNSGSIGPMAVPPPQPSCELSSSLEGLKL
jgi:cysteine dioxygenase